MGYKSERVLKTELISQIFNFLKVHRYQAHNVEEARTRVAWSE